MIFCCCYFPQGNSFLSQSEIVVPPTQKKREKKRISSENIFNKDFIDTVDINANHDICFLFCILIHEEVAEKP